jgi:hypothetical protein
MNEYTYVDMGTISSQNALQPPHANVPRYVPGYVPGSVRGNVKMATTAFDSDFNYDVIEDDGDVKWKNMWLSESKEQMDTTGLAADTDLDHDEETYAQGISTFRSPTKHQKDPSHASHGALNATDFSPEKLVSERSDPATHEYAVPVITPASSSVNSLNHVTDPSPHVNVTLTDDATDLNFPAIVPPSSIKPLLKSNKPQRSPAKRSSKHLSNERMSRKTTRSSGNPEPDPDYMPVTVIYNENTKDQLI